ncbi:porin [Massilia sp. CCM 8734]|uniref:porin n=1 Tax=Massilia sp. CCM 8734 TaxID=2609283 RepID=UPI00141ED9EA|nr:porin [Massilia sp. CCM 8734]NHZ96407.1 porin [Massilia sp. CCM 8734]
MNKIIIAIMASSLVPAAAMAQSAVTVYGVADVGFVRETGGAEGSVNTINSGVASGSRLGFKGTEDLGGGVKAYFVLENGMKIDTGSAAQGGLLFGRQAYLGVSGQSGAVSFGRQYSPYYRAMRDIVDPFCDGLAGQAGNITASNARLDNMVGYASPTLYGFAAELAVGVGEVPGNSAAKRAYSTALSYTAKTLVVTLGWHQQQNALASDSSANTLLGARYDWGVAEGHLGYARNKGLLGARSNDAIVGASVPFGPHKVYASYVRHDDTTHANRDASQWGLGYTYALSKRTDLYAAYARIGNRNGATFKVGNATTDGTGNTGANLGIRHTF